MRSGGCGYRLRGRPTFQSDGLWAVEMQQGGQSTAVCVVLKQVLHQGERWRAPLLGMIPPAESLKPWQQHKDTTYVSSGWISTVGFLIVGAVSAKTLVSACTSMTKVLI